MADVTPPRGSRKVQHGYAVRVTSDEVDMYVRHGARIGEGRIVRYHTRQDAERAIDLLSNGLDARDFATIVPYSDIPREEHG